MKETKWKSKLIDILCIIISSIFFIYFTQYVLNIPLILSIPVYMSLGFLTIFLTNQYKISEQILVMVLCGFVGYFIIEYSHIWQYGTNKAIYQTVWLDTLLILHTISFFIFGVYAIVRKRIVNKLLIDIFVFLLPVILMTFIGFNVRTNLEKRMLLLTAKIEEQTMLNPKQNYVHEYADLDTIVHTYYSIFITKARGRHQFLYDIQRNSAVAEALSQAESLDDILDVYQQFNTKN